MFDHLQIYNARERFLVGCADALLSGVTAPGRLIPRRSGDAPRRILVLRLERIGDLLMTLAAFDALRARAGGASIHLVVGSWNAALAALLPSIDSVESLDAPWLSRHTAGNTPTALLGRAWRWRARRFDLAVNFEPDIRSNVLLGLSGARRRVGFRSGGGQALLTQALEYDPRQHCAANLLALVDAALPAPTPHTENSQFPRLRVPESALAQAAAFLPLDGHRPLVGLHVSAGRGVKQWPVERFAQLAVRLSREHGAAIVLTGTDDDRAMLERLTALLPADVPVTNAAGAVALPVLGGLLQQLDLLVTGDTGPMHLAAAVGTPLVALFGPSDPARYSPRSDRARVLTTNLWCRPCNRIRRPPKRCTAGVPDCMAGLDVETVLRAALDLLALPKA